MIKNLSPFEIKEILESGERVRLIDVREEWEYNIARLRGAELMPLSRFVDFAPMLNPDEKIIVYCHRGVRSLRVCNYLLSSGYKDLINLEGGINAWSEEIDKNIAKY